MFNNTLYQLQLSWECCPPELIWIILTKLDFRSLSNCMTVNQRWKDVVIYYIEFYGLWQKIAAEQMVNMGVTYKQRSILGWKHLLINSILWSSVRAAQVKHHHTYTLKNIKKMHIFREKLIVKTASHIYFFNVTNSQFIEDLESPSTDVDFTENGHIIVEFMKEKDLHILALYGKKEPEEFCFNECRKKYIHFTLLFKVQGNTCYLVTDVVVVWAITWNRQNWSIRLIGRYYTSANDTIQDIHIFNKEVSMVTKYGLILCEDAKSKKFDRITRCNVDRLEDATNWLLFNRCDIAVSVKRLDRRIRVSYNNQNNHIIMECLYMTCGIEHGEVLFFGFKDGLVTICRPQSMVANGGTPDLFFFVQDYDKSIEDPEVIALEVFEDKMSHHLFIATKHKIIQLLITYPFSVRKYYE